MSYPWTAYKTWVTGEVLTAGDLNSSFTTAITNSDPSSINDYSVNVATMRTTADPYPASAESLATTLAGELERVRYVINQLNGTAQWYIDPSSSIETIVNGTQVFAGAKTFSSSLTASAGMTAGAAVTVTPTTNQLVLGTTRTVTLTAPTPASASRTVTFPDLSGDYSVVGTLGNQTIAGDKTFSGLIGFGGVAATNDPLEVHSATSSAFRGQVSLYDSTAMGAGVGGQIVFGGKYTGSTYSELASIQGTKKSAVDGNLDAQLILRARSAAGGMQNHIVIDGNTKSVTQPLQPSFLVTNSAGATDVTGDGTVYTVLWGNEIYDQGSNFASNTFTAPITGRYLLTATVSVANMLIGHTGRALKIVTTARNYTNDYNQALAEVDRTMSVTCIADMTAGDTAIVTLDVSGATKTVDISASGTLNHFSGSLIN